MPLKIATVEWLDAWFNESAGRLNDFDRTPKWNLTVGFVMEDNDTHILLSMDKLEDDRYRHWFYIPRAFIKDVNYLEL